MKRSMLYALALGSSLLCGCEGMPMRGSRRALPQLKAGEDDEAIADFTEAIRLDPKHADGLLQPGHRLRARRATTTRPLPTSPRPSGWTRNMPRPTTAGAMPTGRRANSTRRSPTTPRPSGWTRNMPSLYQPGHCLPAQGRIRQGDCRLHGGHPAQPEIRRGYCNRGIAYRHKGEYDKAIADYTEAIRLDPKYAKAYNNRGIAYRHKGEFDKAIADYTEAIRLDPKFAVAYCGRGIAYRRRPSYDKAIADYTEAIRLTRSWHARITTAA